MSERLASTFRRAAADDDLKIRGLQEEGKRSGLPYRILLGPSGNLNGYVGVPETHPWFGKDYSASLCGHDGCYRHTPEAKMDVHGGLTFAGKSQQSNFWWFGFDTAHSFDDPRFGGTTKDINYVRAECTKLAKQLAEVKSSATATATHRTRESSEPKQTQERTKRRGNDEARND